MKKYTKEDIEKLKALPKDKYGKIIGPKVRKPNKWVEHMAYEVAVRNLNRSQCMKKFNKTYNTVEYWFNDHRFEAMVSEFRKKAYGEAFDKYKSLASAAVDVVSRYMGIDPETGEYNPPELTPEVRLVAQDILKGTGIFATHSNINVPNGIQISVSKDGFGKL